MRLVRFLAHCGVASRRGAAELVRQGLVQVNGHTTTNVALLVDADDRVTLRGKPVRPPSAPTVLLLHKPAGVICSVRDPHHPRTVLHCLPPKWRNRLKPVGRLDKTTTGLLLLTDDGELLNRLTHPRYGVEKTYRALVAGQVSDAALAALRKGVTLEDGLTAPARVRRLVTDLMDGVDGMDKMDKRDKGDKRDEGDEGDKRDEGDEGDKRDEGDKGDKRDEGDEGDKGDKRDKTLISSARARRCPEKEGPPVRSSAFSRPPAPNQTLLEVCSSPTVREGHRPKATSVSSSQKDPPTQTLLEITIHEGRKRQVRRMCEAVGHPVLRLERTQYGPLRLGDLKPGAHRALTPAELIELRRVAGEGTPRSLGGG